MTSRFRPRALARVALWAIPPMLAALWAGATTIPGGWFEPWNPNMMDLDVYRRTGEFLLQGKDIYAKGEYLPWIYPPFAALFTLPIMALPSMAAEMGWLAINVAALMAMLYRLGLTGWTLSLTVTGAIWLFEPVRETLGFGQLAILLVAAAVLDSMPGPRVFPRRILPEGWLTGIATAVKLTPAIIAVHNFFAGKRREGIVAFLGFLAATLAAFALLPGTSITYWGKLIRGDSGINDGIMFKTNQSVMGVWTRLFGEANRGGLVAAVLVLVLGIAATVALHRVGEVALALCLAGLTGLLVSPISWSHHYVWVLPLAILLVKDATLPGFLRVPGLFFGIWTAFAPYKILPGGDNKELAYSALSMTIDNIGVVGGVALLACGLVAARGPWGRARSAARTTPAAA